MWVLQKHWQALEGGKGEETQKGVSLECDPEQVGQVTLQSSEVLSAGSP